VGHDIMYRRFFNGADEYHHSIFQYRHEYVTGATLLSSAVQSFLKPLSRSFRLFSLSLLLFSSTSHSISRLPRSLPPTRFPIFPLSRKHSRQGRRKGLLLSFSRRSPYSLGPATFRARFLRFRCWARLFSSRKLRWHRRSLSFAMYSCRPCECRTSSSNAQPFVSATLWMIHHPDPYRSLLIGSSLSWIC
jgi:hypothetical protein